MRDAEPMLALTITACGVVLVAAGVLWLKPWIDDYDEYGASIWVRRSLILIVARQTRSAIDKVQAATRAGELPVTLATRGTEGGLTHFSVLAGCLKCSPCRRAPGRHL